MPDAPRATVGNEGYDSDAAQRRFEQQVAERIELGLALLGETDARPLAVIARGQAGFWVAQQQDALRSIDALVLHQPRPAQDGERIEPLLEKWDKPLLDIATKGVLGRSDAARERQLNAQRANHLHYRQILVSNPGNTSQTQQMLIKRIDGWLRKLP